MTQTNFIATEFDFQLDEFYLDLQEDGSRISILDKEKIAKSPFPGLRPFKTSEFQLFKGRDGQAEELIKRLKKNHFLAVIGSSGTGKSSLVRAGLIPQLFGGYLHEAGNKWNIAICRPGKDPVENLAIALASVKGHSKNKDILYKNYETIEPLLSDSIYGVLDVDELLNSTNTSQQKPNLLIIIDQFEELFRFDRKDLGKENIENHFVNLLLKASLNLESSVYVIVTMRSEFLGDCVKYRGLAEAINEGQYLVPQLTRNQLKEVIEGPVNLAGKKISPDLTELLINEIESEKLKENLDQLPILQHALMRTYQEAMKDGPDTEIDYEHYQRTGEMELALPNHAQAKYNELGLPGNDDSNPSKKQKITKIVFQALTDAGTDQKGGRRPTELKNIYAIATSLQAGEEEVDEVINQFRDVETSFIMPPINTALYPGLMLDISHESLMRNWERLNEWIKVEARYGKLYKSLNERRELYENDPDQWVRGVLLRELIEWRDKYPKNAVWASRYHQLPTTLKNDLLHQDIYNSNLQFLATSESKNLATINAEKKKMQDEIESAQKEKSRRKTIWVFASSSIISVCFGLWAFSESNRAEEQSKLAIASADTAKMQREIAEKKATEATKQRERADLIADSASKLRIVADQKAMEADSQRLIAEGYAKQFQLQKDRALSQNEESKKQLVKNALQKEKFYSSNVLDPDTKESIIASLFREPLNTPAEIPLADYVYVDLLESINLAVAAREQVLDSPIQGLRKAALLWSKAKNQNSPYIQKILLGIFKSNIFYKQQIEPISTDRFSSFEFSSLAVSEDAARFAYNYMGRIASGTYDNDSLRMDKGTADKVNFNNYNLGNTPGNYYAGANILALTYIKNDKILSFRDDGRIIEWSKGGEKQIDSLTSINNINVILAEFTPDGSSLVVASRDGSIKKWNIEGLRSGKDYFKSYPALLDSTAQNKYVSQVIFSPDSKRMIKFYSTGQIEGWNLSENKAVLQFKSDQLIYTANFSPDGKYILAAATGNTIYIMDSSGKWKSSLSLSSAISDNGEQDYFYARIDHLTLSPDWKKLIVMQNGKIFLYHKEDGGVMVNPEKTGNEREINLRYRKLTGSQDEIRKILFLNANSVLSLNYQGYIQLWNITEKFDDLDGGFASIKKITALTFMEKLESGQMSFNQVISLPNKEDARRAANYYYNGNSFNFENDAKRKENLNNAKKLYAKLVTLDMDEPVNLEDDKNRLILLNETLANLERAESKPDFRQVVKLYKESADIGESLLKNDLSDSTQRKKLSLTYWGLSWNQVFIKDFDGAIASALRGYELYPANDGINTNLALGYLLNTENKFQSADSIYRMYKGKHYTNGSTLFTDAFLQDFIDLEAAGVIVPNDPRVNKIRAFLKLK